MNNNFNTVLRGGKSFISAVGLQEAISVKRKRCISNVKESPGAFHF